MLLLTIVFYIVFGHLFELDDVIVDILCVRSAIILHGSAALRNLVLRQTRIIFTFFPMLKMDICNYNNNLLCMYYCPSSLSSTWT